MDILLEHPALVYGVVAVVVAVLPAPRARRLGGLGLVFLGLGSAADQVGGSGGGAPGSFTTINEVLAIAGIVLAGAALFAVMRGRLTGPVAAAAPSSSAGHPGLDPFLVSGIALAALAPHLLAVGMGLLLGLVAGIRGSVRAGSRLWLVPLLAGAGFMGVGLSLILTILGPMGGRLTALPAGPFSPPAERLLVMLLGSATFLLSGLPFLTRAPWRLALAPLGAIVLARIMAPGFPQGLAEWRPLAMLLLVVMLAAAALTRRWAAVAVSGGLAALWSGDPGAMGPGMVLVCSGWVADQGETLRAKRGIALAPNWSGVPALIPALAAPPALVSGLGAEVLLSTFAALMLAFRLAGDARPPARRQA